MTTTVSTEVTAAATALRGALTDAAQGLVERETLVELIALAAVAGEHILVIGPPGTAKSEAARRVSRAATARYFEYLLGRFTEPSEIFGPVNLRRLREGVVETETAGMLPEAEIAFLDEVFLGSTAILNTLLAILNERTFRRGHTQRPCPLRVCVGASNSLPEDESLAAFADRFLLRVFLEPIPPPLLEELLTGGWSLGQGRTQRTVSLAELDTLTAAARGADLAKIRPRLAHAIRLLREAGIVLTDRRAVKAQTLIAAAAVMAGRVTPSEADLWPLIYAVPTAEAQRTAREALRELLSSSQNFTLSAAVAEAAQGPLARAERVAQTGRRILSERPSAGDAEADEAWRLKLESVARELDASFSSRSLPTELSALRTELVEALKERA